MLAVSMIICTKNRATALASCLAAVRALDPEPPFEFILVDNGSDDGTPEVFCETMRTAGFNAKYVREDRAGVGWALKAGMAASDGDIIICTDDDCYPDPDIVEVARTVFADPLIGVVQGSVLLFDKADVRETVKEASQPRTFAPGMCVQVGDFIGANLLFRREALVATGGFDPLFGPGSVIGSGADIDAAGRVILGGWTGAYAPELVVRHHHRRRPEDMPALIRRYDRGRGAFLMKQWLMAPWRQKPWVTAIFVRDLIKAQGPDKALGVLTGAARYLRHRSSGVEIGIRRPRRSG